ncbi:hypothetical protein AN640_02525 [Candidatus Epulonipiscium fishelsonii]|uniref:Uncharacterized protein n=1 Tax=Candidatus Epulonipiscium fishelsonii TaxID=77094 RepID=A0ACC8X947_9FIRM|nr:hypothetical protein AN640_02525 [Epulopiscium sp. SCG-D08WGA-EpuloA1]
MKKHIALLTAGLIFSSLSMTTPATEVAETYVKRVTETPKTEVTETPKKRVTETSKKRVTETSKTEVAEALEIEVSETYVKRVTETAETEVAEAPVKEIAETAETEIAETLETEVAETLETGVAEAPVKEIAETAETEVTEAPVKEIAETAETGMTEAPVKEIAETEVTETLETGVTEAPVKEIAETEVTETLETGVTEAPVKEIAETEVTETLETGVTEAPVKEIAETEVTETLETGVTEAPVKEIAETEVTETLETGVTEAPVKEIADFVIVHTNDTHGRIVSGDYDGMGLSRVSTIINEAETTYGEENVLILDAGDTLHGQPIVSVSEGKSITSILNIMGYDAMVPGNHDFNYGTERLIELDEMLDLEMIAANVTDNITDEPILNPYIIEEVGGQKVGIFGLATPETSYKTNPLNVENITFQDPFEVATEIVKELEGQVDFIIALSHLGVEGEWTSIKLAEEVEGINLIVDGHSHTELPEGQLVNDTYIVQAGEFNKNVGIVEIDVLENDEFEILPKLITKEEGMLLEEDEDVVEAIEVINAEFDYITGLVVGHTDIFLDGERESVRTGETSMGNLITNAMLLESGADIALTNGGGIRASIEEGNITKRDVINVLPFGNYIVTIEVTGQEIYQAIEMGIDAYPQAKGAFPHIAGMHVIFDESKPAGGRIVEIRLDSGEMVKTDEVYLLATNDFIRAGGDEYTMFVDNPIMNEYSALDEAVIEYLLVKGTEGTELNDRILVTTIDDIPLPVFTAEDLAKKAEEEAKKEEAKKEEEDKLVAVTLEVYTIEEGDSLGYIANLYDTSISELRQINEIEDSDVIFIGDKIIVPSKKVVEEDTMEEITEEVIEEDIIGEVVSEELVIDEEIMEGIMEELIEEDTMDEVMEEEIEEDIMNEVMEEVEEEITEEDTMDEVMEEEIIEEDTMDEVEEEITEEDTMDEVMEEVIEEDTMNEVKEEIIEEDIMNEVIEEVEEELIEEDIIEEVEEEITEEEIIEEDTMEEEIEEDTIEEVEEEITEEDTMDEVMEEDTMEEVIEEVREEDIMNEVTEEDTMEEVIEEVREEDIMNEVIEEVIEEVREEVREEDIMNEVTEEVIEEDIMNEVTEEEITEEDTMEEVEEEKESSIRAWHTIKWGDSLNYISMIYGIPVERLIEVNGITRPDLILVGNQLIIPTH